MLLSGAGSEGTAPHLQGLTIKFEKKNWGSTAQTVNARETCDIYIKR